MNAANQDVKKKCPYMEKCYRKNPIHFSEMSHPHLEIIVQNQLDGEIKIPKNLSFTCTNEQLLKDQLKVLQIVLRREQKASTSACSSKTNVQNAEVNRESVKPETTNSAVSNGTSSLSDDLKAKIERNRQAALQRRENKLKELDAQAAAFSKGLHKNTNENQSCDDTDDIEVIEVKVKGSSLPTNKRINENSSDTTKVKRLRTDNKKHNSEMEASNSSGDTQSTSQKSSQDSPGSKSILESYNSCTSMKSRIEMRSRAIQMMKRSGFEVSVVEPGNFITKHANAAPYYIFFSRVQKSKETYDQPYSITFPEILDRSLGEIESSLQINFMVDVGWLCLQYLLAGQSTKMMIVYGERVDTEKLPPAIQLIPISMPSRFGCHHSKLMILAYKDESIRIVVSTANLYSDDWENRTQGLWISPTLPRLPDSANPGEGESPTGFKKDLERYLRAYAEPVLTEWQVAVRRADFSAVNVVFIGSVPGKHSGPDAAAFGHRKLAAVLSKHATLPPDAPQWTVVAQSSSIGSLGPNYESWLYKDIVSSMCRETTEGLKSHANFRFIYPTLENYTSSFDCRSGSCCLPYGLQTHSRQEWIESYLYQWKASRTGRDRAMPHIKSYTRYSPDLKQIPWFILTSANLSKAAWGYTQKTAFGILNYEAGVAFLPKFITNTTTFPIVQDAATTETPVFPIPYDLPLTRYGDEDKPFVNDFLSS